MLKSERFEMRFDAATLEKLDAWRLQQGGVSRAEAVRDLVQAGVDREARPKLTDGERLIIMLLCDLIKGGKIKSEFDPDFLVGAIYGGHYWALAWEYSGLFSVEPDQQSVVREVVDILYMWRFIEAGYVALAPEQKEQLKEDADPFGTHVVFPGFDGNNEGEHLSVARFMIERMGRFESFAGRGSLNSHHPSLETYRRMYAAFEPMRAKLVGRELSYAELVELMKARMYR